MVERALRCTLREPSFVFLTEENKRSPCLNHMDVKPLKSPSPNFWTSQSCFLASNWFFLDKPMIRTEPAVPTARLLGLDSKLYPSKMQHMLNKDFTRFMPRLCPVQQNRASERKALLDLLTGWLWCDASIFKANFHNVDKFQLDHLTLCGNLLRSSADILFLNSSETGYGL